MKPQASPEYNLSDLAGPGERGRSGRAPNTPWPFLFLLEEKEAKDYLGGHPLKTPEGERSGRVPLTPTAGILSDNNKHIESQ